MAISSLNPSHFSFSVVSLIKILPLSFSSVRLTLNWGINNWTVTLYNIFVIFFLDHWRNSVQRWWINRNNFNINAPESTYETGLENGLQNLRSRGIEQWYWLFREEGKQSSPSNPFQHRVPTHVFHVIGESHALGALGDGINVGIWLVVLEYQHDCQHEFYRTRAKWISITIRIIITPRINVVE